MDKQNSAKPAGLSPGKAGQVTGAPGPAATVDFNMPGKEDDAADVLLAQDDVSAPAPSETTKNATSDQTAAFAMKGPGTQAVSAPKAAPVPPPAPPSAQQKKTLGDYVLLKKLGQGGMGVVYLAHQTSLDRQVALKVLSKELAAKPAFVERFKREARVMAKLDHANILRSYDVGEILGYNYLAMEFVEGGSLGDWLKKLKRLPLADAVHIILTCANALQHAHELSLIHRDIKPDNILLTKKGMVKVADLGLAKATDEDLGLTKTGTGAGTPLYMAPEQARDAKHVDKRSDIYALGCMLYVFLTGEFPFKGETLVEVIESKEKGKFTPSRRMNDDVPERLDLIIDKMLTPKPEHRYQSCAELILDLDKLGLSSKNLSFFPVEGPAPRSAAAISAPKQVAVKGSTTSGSVAEEDYWYAQYVTKDGKSMTRKMTPQEIIGQLRSKAFDAETQISKTRKGGYRALGTHHEFAHLIKATLTKEKADRKAEKFKTFYEQIDKQEQSRQRWRWFHNKMLRAGGFLGLLLWLAVIAGVGIGLYFLVMWAWPILKEKIGLG